ncbi:MAG: tetratricopeptide repeat protein [Ignavibacteria bacterium]|nr:tetratricopeptide repeat protein [Ignavibacteria bacterium]
MMRQTISTAMYSTIVALMLFGCSSSQKSTTDETSQENRELSLKHFLEGSLHDQKNEYAQAILDYQEALRYKKDPAIFHAIAKDYAILGKNERAIEAGREAVKLEPANRIYRETLAEIYVNAMNLEEAIGEYEAIVRMDSSYQQAWLTLARLEQIKNPQQALVLYQKYIDHFGPDADAFLQIAQIYGSMGKLDKAAESLTRMLALDPGNFEIKKALGDTYLHADSIDAALKIYNDLVELHPEHFELRAAIAHAYLVKQDYDHAAEQFDIVLRRDTLSVEDQLRFGQVFVSFIQKDSAVAPYALKLFEKVQGNYPSDWRPYWFLGAIHNILHDDSSAFPNFLKVKELASWNPDGWMGIAGMYYDKNQFDSTINVLMEAKKFVPDEFRVHFLLGVAYQRKRDLVNAASSLEKALQLNVKSLEAMTVLALVYDELKRKDDSDTLYERALLQDPHNHLVLNNYSYSLAERGLQLERALRMAKEAIEQQPNNQSYLDTYGWVNFQLGKFEEGEKYIHKAVDLGSASAVIFEHLGDIHYKLLHKDKAIEYWQKALDLDSSNAALKEKIQRGSL